MSGKQPDCYTFESLFRGSIQVKCLDMVSELHGFVIKMGLERSHALIRSMIDAFGKCGSLVNAKILFERPMRRD